MKTISFFFFLLLLLLTFTSAFSQTTSEEFVCGGKMKDYDGNEYNTVQIGSQCWMKENMRTTRAADGVSISAGTSTSNSTAYRYAPNHDTANVSSYGYLYNYPAALKVCPTGWHLPSKAEFEELMSYCGQHYAIGGNSDYIAKALADKTGWDSSANDYAIGNTPSSNNASGFSALPAGYGYGFSLFGEKALFWSATSLGSYTACRLKFADYDKKANLDSDGRQQGFSVRCLCDK